MHHLLSSLLFVTVLLTATSAAPAKLQRRSFKVKRQRQSNYVPNGLAALQKTYRKYGWAMPEAFTSASASELVAGANGSSGSGETGDTTATPEQNDSEFLAPINIGGQTLMMDFDTGSSDLWVFSTDLPTSESTSHTLYDPSKSSTFQNMTGSTFQIQYGDGSGASGVVGTDTVNIGGAAVTSQAVELATSVSAEFVQDALSDGLVGLAFSSLNSVQPQPQNTFFANVQSSLAEPLFTANLKHATAGAYEFGVIDNSQFVGDIAYIPVDNSQGFWQFSSTSFAVGNGSTQQNEGASPALADTGTSLMVVDDNVAQAYWGQVQGSVNDAQQGGFVFPCGQGSPDPPDFHVAMGDNVATIPGALMNFAQVAENSDTCFGGLQSNAGQGIQIYGDVMFKAQFVVFDGGNNQLGIAPHV